MIAETDALRLKEAIEIAFPRGGMTVSGLRREAQKGRLEISRIAGKDWTTLSAIKDMMEKCRVQPREPASGFAPAAGMPPAPLSSMPDESSRTRDIELALASARETLRKLKENCRIAEQQKRREKATSRVPRYSHATRRAGS
jgi:hypothetical protein